MQGALEKQVKGGVKLDIGGYKFIDPEKFADWTPPNKAGVYAILANNTKIYIGQSGNLSDRGFFRNHHRYNCWIRQTGGSEDKLYISVHLMPDSTESDRKKIESELINKLDPICNKE